MLTVTQADFVGTFARMAAETLTPERECCISRIAFKLLRDRMLSFGALMDATKYARPQRPARVVSRQHTTQCRARRQQHTSKAAASASGDGGDSDPARPSRPHLSPVLPPHCRLSTFRLEVRA